MHPQVGIARHDVVDTFEADNAHFKTFEVWKTAHSNASTGPALLKWRFLVHPD